MPLKLEPSPILPTLTTAEVIISWSRDLILQLTRILSTMTSSHNDLVDGRLDVLRLTVQTSAPTDPADGWVAFADGTSWDPGSGVGLYEYRSGGWNKL
ncbi:MAG: hypothetical protein WC822_02320 [Candidatus Paceibacterota bacterium]